MTNRTLRDIVIGTVLTGLTVSLFGVSLNLYNKIKSEDVVREEVIKKIEYSNPELVYVYPHDNIDSFWWGEDINYRTSESLIAFRERVKKLNPGLDFGKLQIGDTISIPNLDGHYQCPELNKNKGIYG